MLDSSRPHGEGAELPREAAPWPDVLVRGPEVTQDVAVLARLGLSAGVCVVCGVVGSSHQRTAQGRTSLFLSEVLPSGTEEPAAVT